MQILTVFKLQKHASYPSWGLSNPAVAPLVWDCGYQTFNVTLANSGMQSIAVGIFGGAQRTGANSFVLADNFLIA